MNDLRNHFRPEFLNRIDETILFKPLTRDNIGGIVELIVANLNKRLVDKDIEIVLTDEAKKYVADNGYDPVYGARPLKRFIQKNVETLVARVILEGRISMGDVITIDVANNQLVVK